MSNGVGGALADGDSFDSSLTLEGDLVAFSSEASNLVSGDSNGVSDVFVANVRTGVVERVSISTTGEQAHAPSFDAHISGNGRRYVAFRSTATNLVPGDTNEEFDAFVHDRLRDTTARVSVSSSGEQSDGFTRDVAISGHAVVFTSSADDLAPDDNKSFDVFGHDLRAGTTSLVSVDSNGTEISAGSFTPDVFADRVVFQTDAALAPGDRNRVDDIYLHDRSTGKTRLVSVVSGTRRSGKYASYMASLGSGRVSFSSESSLDPRHRDDVSATDVFVHDLRRGTTRLVSVSRSGGPADSGACCTSMSDDGRRVVFASGSSNLVRGDTNGKEDAFVRDLVRNRTYRASVSSTGRQGWGHSTSPFGISGEGRTVSFVSGARNLVTPDVRRSRDVLVNIR